MQQLTENIIMTGSVVFLTVSTLKLFLNPILKWTFSVFIFSSFFFRTERFLRGYFTDSPLEALVSFQVEKNYKEVKALLR